MKRTAALTAICLLMGVLAGTEGAGAAERPEDKKAPEKKATDAPDKNKAAIRELGTGTELKWTDVKVPDVTVTLTIEALSEKGVGAMVLTATPFSGSGYSHDVKLDNQAPPLAIEALQQAQTKTVKLTASLPAAGTFRSQLQLHEKGARLLAATIEIARTRTAVPVEFDAVPARIVPLALSGDPATEAFTTTLISTGEKVKLGAPRVKSVLYRGKAAASTTGVAAPDIKVVPEPQGNFDVDANSQPFKITVSGIRTPGQYDVVLNLVSSGYGPVEVPFTFYARQDWWVAALFILLGVVVSLFLRYYGVIGRPSLVNRQRVTTLFRELDEHAALAGSDERALALVQDMRRKLSDQWNRQSALGTLTDASALDVYAAKIAALAPWFQLRTRVARLQPASLRESFEKELAEAEGELRKQAATTADVDAQTKILDAMPAKIDGAVTKELRAQAAALTAQLPGEARFDDIRAGLAQQIEPDLAAGRIDEAAARLQALQRRYVGIMTDDLERALATAPVGVDPGSAEWKAASANIADSLLRVRKAAAADEASAVFRQALTLFLRIVTASLAAKVEEGIAQSTHKTEYEQMKNALANVPPLIDKGELSAAWRQLTAVQDDFARVRGKPPLGPLQGGALGAVLTQGQAAAADFDILSVFRGPGGELAKVISITGSAAGLRRAGDIVATLVILLAAILIGIQALWTDTLTWGGFPSFAAAFLWGLGFDQLTHAGLVALIKKN